MHELASNSDSQLESLGLIGEHRAHVDAPTKTVGGTTASAAIVNETDGAGEGIRTLDLDLGKVALYR